jgi:hypothetical protein
MQAHKEHMHFGSGHTHPSNAGRAAHRPQQTNTPHRHTGALLRQVGSAPNCTSSQCFWHVQACAACTNKHVQHAEMLKPYDHCGPQYHPASCAHPTATGDSAAWTQQNLTAKLPQNMPSAQQAHAQKLWQRSKHIPTYSRNPGKHAKLSNE